MRSGQVGRPADPGGITPFHLWVVWILESWPGGPAAAATAIGDSPAFGRSHASKMVDRLFDEFSSLDRLGPSSFVRFVAPPTATQDERARLARQALGAVNELQTALVRGAARVIAHGDCGDATVNPHLALAG